MTEEEIKHLKDTAYQGAFNKKDNIWIKAFRLYNEENEGRLGMGCGVCYRKVLEYFRTKKSE